MKHVLLKLLVQLCLVKKIMSEELCRHLKIFLPSQTLVRPEINHHIYIWYIKFRVTTTFNFLAGEPADHRPQ